jgi:two-component system, LytTR family, sensor kinase
MNRSFDIKLVKFYLWVALAHCLLWMFYDFHAITDHFFNIVSNNIWRSIYVLVVNVVFFEFSYPFVIRKRKYLVYNYLLGILLLWIHMLLWSYGLYTWRSLGIVLHTYTVLTPFVNMSHALEAQMSFSMAGVFFYGISRHIYNYVKLKQAAQQLRIEKQAAELNYLKSQTNPHFLFNTLNNIYSLARDKSDLAPESILRLSKILRFMLYETGGAYIAADQELQIISDYIALEKLRYDESLLVNFNYDVEDMKQALPPLLLMPLVENAFKHGVSETRDHPFIDIHLSIKNRQLGFFVKNSTETFSSAGITKENIGLSNLRRQLELLYTDYDLSVKQGEGFFTAILKINLASHV